jgi:hypothetical protein
MHLGSWLLLFSNIWINLIDYASATDFDNIHFFRDVQKLSTAFRSCYEKLLHRVYPSDNPKKELLHSSVSLQNLFTTGYENQVADFKCTHYI